MTPLLFKIILSISGAGIIGAFVSVPFILKHINENGEEYPTSTPKTKFPDRNENNQQQENDAPSNEHELIQEDPVALIPNNKITLYMVSEDIKDYVDISNQPFLNDKQNFKCSWLSIGNTRINGQRKSTAVPFGNEFYCEIEEFNDISSKNYHRFDEIANFETKSPTTETLKTKGKLFKVSFDKANKTIHTQDNHRIGILNKNNNNKKNAILKQWKIEGQSIQRSNYLIAQAITNPVSWENSYIGDSYTKCSFNNIVDENNSCYIYIFSSTESNFQKEGNYKKLTFDSFTTKINGSFNPTTIETNRYYLIQFDNLVSTTNKPNTISYVYGKSAIIFEIKDFVISVEGNLFII